jgi:hypothetical protein
LQRASTACNCWRPGRAVRPEGRVVGRSMQQNSTIAAELGYSNSRRDCRFGTATSATSPEDVCVCAPGPRGSRRRLCRASPSTTTGMSGWRRATSWCSRPGSSPAMNGPWAGS